ncbi:flagellar hook-basal body complex protein FliE [Halopseudomonas phragmitis]|uniref:Flagellar hook-basal body complex protein FliE n=2 Tax=Pseudomonadaceae TaxID=135621 RepID=A0A1V0B1F0_9GAMM|nr:MULTISPECIES: flagellar hook-basal body complex protein FliE [Pseudomonadaceae]AQZ93759.1 flagellar hook-basal body protein FliE [Halopseudomonas phragmitis]RHW20088.1 flagellar hook-basal body protein FliE [Pseudomonas jilinensis]
MNSITQVQQQMLERMSQMQAASSGAVVRAALDKPPVGGVGQAFTDVLRTIDSEQHLASQALADVDSGKSKDLVGAMIQSQKASLSFAALVQVRNKMSSAFDEIMRMPV